MKRDPSILPHASLGIAWLFIATAIALPARSADTAAAPGTVFNVRDFGARGDGSTPDTAALQQAIDAASAAGGGEVRLPAGRYLSGTLLLRSHLTLWLDAGARLIGTTNLAAYQQPTPPEIMPEARWGKWHRGLLVGENLEDVTLAGPGTIDGNKVFDPTGEERLRGPHTLVFVNSRRFTIRDLTFVDAANYAVLFLASDDVLVRNVRFIGGWDGVHFRGAPGRDCRNVKILDCEFYTGDDSIAGRYWRHTLISGCVVNSSCNGVRLLGPATGLTIHNCLFQGPGEQPHRSSRERRRTNMLAGIVLQPGAWDPTRGPLDDVLISDVTMRNVASPVTIWTKGDNPVGRITVERLSATGVYRAAASVESWSGTPIANVVFRDVSLEFTGGGTLEDAARPVRGPGVDARPLPAWAVYARQVANLQLDHVRVRFAKEDLRPALVAENVERLVLEDFDYDQPEHPPANWTARRLEQVKQLVEDASREHPPQP